MREILSPSCWAGGGGWNLFSGQWKTNRGGDRWDKRTQASFSKKSLALIKHQEMIAVTLGKMILVLKHICYSPYQNIQARQKGEDKTLYFQFYAAPIPSNCKSNKWEHNLIKVACIEDERGTFVFARFRIFCIFQCLTRNVTETRTQSVHSTL